MRYNINTNLTNVKINGQNQSGANTKAFSWY